MTFINPRRLAGNIARRLVMSKPVTGRYLIRSILGTTIARAFFSAASKLTGD
jgi:hypothetical protein